MWRVLFLLAAISSVAYGQDAPPARIDTITASHVVCLLSSTPPTNYSVAWFNAGFGRINSTTNAPIPIATGTTYTLFKITNPANGPMDDYWVTPTPTWDAYITSSNVPALRAGSFNFQSFQFSANYTPPTLTEPVTWEDRTPVLTVGYTSENTLLVVRKQGLTWEWSVRGASGSDVWTQAADKDLAKEAAEAALPQ